MKKVSIVIVTYNSADEIGRCINSIYENNDIGDSLEIVVVDNHSNDIDNLKMVLSRYKGVNLVENTSNGGYGQGNNLGISISTAPIIMVMNPDVRLFMPVFNKVYQFFCNNSNCAMVGLQQYEDENKLGQSFISIDNSITNLLRLKFYKKFNSYNPKYSCFSGACFFLNKELFESVGGFDENIFLYGEEVDINIRLRTKGYDLLFLNSLGYIHPLHNRELTYQTLIRGYQSFLYNYTKHKMNVRKGLHEMIIYFNILRVRAILLQDKSTAQIYDEYIKFLRGERKVINKYISNKNNND